MKLLTLALAAIVATNVATIAPANAKPKTKVIWIEEPDTEDFSDRDLKRKVARLEKAVAQLQRRVFELEFKDPAKGGADEVIEKKYTCYIETPFEGLVSETRSSLTEAKAAVAKACNDKTKNSLSCKVEKATCGE